MSGIMAVRDMSPYMVEIIRSKIDNQDPPPHNMDRFVRIKHIESGITVTKYAKSQLRAKEMAVDELVQLVGLWENGEE